jgi:SAM-dependent methyltransferase
MFDIEFLHVIREFEYVQVVKRLPAGARVLEIGGGTGYQAKRLVQDGFLVTSIDVPQSNYADQQEFPVQPYDGVNIPFPAQSFDVVFSSNVLEHVLHLGPLQEEVKRVLRCGGYCVHLMPTAAWRFWTSCTHYTEMMQHVVALLPRLIPRGLSRHALADAGRVLALIVATVRRYAIVGRHGEKGTALSELVTFSPRYWRRHFIEQRFEIQEIAPAGLFYTGYMLFGKRLSVRSRQSMAGILGSACAIYVVRPRQS